jgi:hypothetical protein
MAWCTDGDRGVTDHATVTGTVSEGDRRWFEDHPGAQRYTRPADPHEFCPFLLGLCFEFVGRARIHNLAPGIRGREPLGYFLVPRGTPPRTLQPLFDLGCGAVEMASGRAA